MPEERLAEQDPRHHRGARWHQVKQAGYLGGAPRVDQEVEQRTAAERQGQHRPRHRADQLRMQLDRLLLEQRGRQRDDEGRDSCTVFAVRHVARRDNRF